MDCQYREYIAVAAIEISIPVLINYTLHLHPAPEFLSLYYNRCNLAAIMPLNNLQPHAYYFQ